MKIQALIDSLQIKFREKLNPYFAVYRRRRIKGNFPFTIISNNCWGGHVYRYFGLPYDSPTIGLYFFSQDYIKFISDLKKYLSTPLLFIPLDDSKYKEILIQRGGENINCPIGLLGDIEIIFLHYKSPEEALSKWNRRCERIHWDNLYIKMSEQNLCSVDILKEFDKLKYERKFVLTTRNYDLKSQIIYKKYYLQDAIQDDTTHFRSFIQLDKWINGV